MNATGSVWPRGNNRVHFACLLWLVDLSLLSFLLLAQEPSSTSADTHVQVATSDQPAATLPKGTVVVQLYLYDYTLDEAHPCIETDGKLHPGVVPAHTKELKKEQIDAMLRALTQNHPRNERLLCGFSPHHGIVFRDEENRIIGSVSLCFTCLELQSKTFPNRDKYFFQYWDWLSLRSLFREAGLPLQLSQKEYNELRTASGVKTGTEQPVQSPEPNSSGTRLP